jgi:hypothetical protein
LDLSVFGRQPGLQEYFYSYTSRDEDFYQKLFILLNVDVRAWFRWFLLHHNFNQLLKSPQLVVEGISV